MSARCTSELPRPVAFRAAVLALVGALILSASLTRAGEIGGSQVSSSSGSDSSPPPSPPPSSDSSSSSSSSSSYSSSSNDYYYNDPYISSDHNFPSVTRRAYPANQRLPVFFPPMPPVLGGAFQSGSSTENRWQPPAELAQFVNEPFYAPLSTRLWAKGKYLNARQQQELENYRLVKVALQNELREHLERLKDADPDTRERELAAFAREQTPKIAALEKTAEQLRAELVRGELFQDSVDWNEYREWHLGSTKFRLPSEAVSAQFQVLRAAAFYQKGFSPAQRRLLREITLEISSVLIGVEGNTTSAPYLFFSPETARIRLPASLPPDLADKVARYESEKSALKKELIDAVTQQDTTFFSFARVGAFESLSDKQWPRFAALESLAEDIRHGLARLPNGGAPDAPVLPAGLSSRIAAYQKEKANLNSELTRRLSAVPATAPVFDSALSVSARLEKLKAARAERDEQIRKEIDSFKQENAARYAALTASHESIRNELVELARVHTGEAGANLSPDALIRNFAAAVRQAEEWKHTDREFHEYKTAVLQPGLSPEQRRLLFDASLEDLNLQLPGGAMQPATSVY
jgi:hypothetical protein